MAAGRGGAGESTVARGAGLQGSTLFDLSLKNDYISPRGVLVTDTDRIVHVLWKLGVQSLQRPERLHQQRVVRGRDLER